jgi:hypothetical protein
MLSEEEVGCIIAASHLVKPHLRGGNSTVSRVEFDGSIYAVKNYSERSDGDQRLLQEYAGLNLVSKTMPRVFPKPIGIDLEQKIGVFSWVSGIRPNANLETILQMLEILNRLHQLGSKIGEDHANNAVDSIILIHDVLVQIEERIKRFDRGQLVINELIEQVLIPQLNRYKETNEEISAAVVTLSPSDFGVHNLLWDREFESMHCVDFEFFGWDDAHKLVCDTLLHPQSTWEVSEATKFLEGVNDIYQLNEGRIIRLWPLLSMKWSTIVLHRVNRDLLRSDEVSARRSIKLVKSYLNEASQPPRSLTDIVERSNMLTIGRK